MSWSRRTGLSTLLVAILAPHPGSYYLDGVLAAMGRGFWTRPAIVDTAQVARDPLVITVQ